MANKIFRSTIFVAAIVLLCSIAVIMGVLYDYFDHSKTAQLQNELDLAAAGTLQGGRQYLESVPCEDFRLTWISPDGQVLFDSMGSNAKMENHADREEIRQAFQEGTGSSSRYSSTLLEKTRYEAMRLTDGSVLRISSSQATTAALGGELLWPVALVILVAAALSAVLARRIARRIVKPLNELDLEHPLENRVYEEIDPLLRRINQLHLEISRQLQILKQKTDQFDKTTSAMKEGLVLLDRDDRVVTLNPAAARLLQAQEDCTGRDFLTIDSSREMRHAVDKVFLEGSSSLHVCRQGRQYHMDMSRIESEGAVIGAVILAFDVTDRENAERNRREFTANVSHELKTPLQAIMGSAELMETGLVKPEDQRMFVANIRKEAARLLMLIEDIIRLSQLDEGMDLPQEQVNIGTLSREILDSLERTAQQKKVTMKIEGDGFGVQGSRRLIYEILYNLCENAVKYNREGGSVTLGLHGPAVTVEDTGIGIPEEHRTRVFERFYRVDKSHSRQSGGTGLGLSIVKHAALQLGAKVSLRSEPGKGTAVEVRFPSSRT